MSLVKELSKKYQITGSDEDITKSIQKLGILRVNGILAATIKGMMIWDDPLTKQVIKKLQEAKDLINEDARKMYS